MHFAMLTEILTDGAFVFWSAVTLMVVVPSIMWAWASVRKTEISVALKRDMIARGLSAEEIERVLKAGEAQEE